MLMEEKNITNTYFKGEGLISFYFRYASLSFILSGLIKSTAGSFDTEFDYNEVILYFFGYKTELFFFLPKQSQKSRFVL